VPSPRRARASREARTIRCGGTAERLSTISKPSVHGTTNRMSSAKRIPNVCTEVQRGISNPYSGESTGRPASPTSRSRRRSAMNTVSPAAAVGRACKKGMRRKRSTFK
jgi:hypothetical protein